MHSVWEYAKLSGSGSDVVCWQARTHRGGLSSIWGMKYSPSHLQRLYGASPDNARSELEGDRTPWQFPSIQVSRRLELRKL